MTDQDAIRDDIAFMRGLAEAGRDGPMRGGAILLAAGSIFGIASLAVYWLSVIQGASGWMYWAVWGVAGIIFLGAFVPLVRGVPRTGSTRQIVAGMAWTGMGWASSAIWFSLMVMSLRTRDSHVMLALLPVYMSLYGGAWFVAALAWRKAWMWLTAFAACAAALTGAWFAADGPIVWLIYGVSLMAVLALPGLHLMRQSRAAG